MDVLWADRDSLPLDDRGLAYGDGLFETIRVRGSDPVFLPAHVDRLLRDARRLSIPVGSDAILAAIEQATQCYRQPDSTAWVLKLMLTRGSGGRGYRLPDQPAPRLIVSAHDAPPIPDNAVSVSLADEPLWVDPATAGVKSLNRLPQVMASQGLGGDIWERVMTDGRGGMLEGTRTNLMACVGGEWLTPPVSSLAVAGVARSAALELLSQWGASVRERSVPMDALDDQHFAGLLLMNSVTGAVMVSRLGRRSLPFTDALGDLRAALNQQMGLNR